MMARTHALTGAAAWLALAPPVAEASHVPLTATTLAAGTVVTAGAALLPDLDHPHSSAARAVGPLTQLLARGIAALAGGHRQATHSLLFCAALGTFLTVAMRTPAAQTIRLVTVLLCVGLTLRALGPRHVRSGGLVDLTLTGGAVAVTYSGWQQLDAPGWLPAAVTLGALVHLLGDLLTPGGVPLLWPISARQALPALPRTGGLTEHLLAAGLTLAVCWLGHQRLTSTHQASDIRCCATALLATEQTASGHTHDRNRNPSAGQHEKIDLEQQTLKAQHHLRDGGQA